jgi:hypothetical protein
MPVLAARAGAFRAVLGFSALAVAAVVLIIEFAGGCGGGSSSPATLPGRLSALQGWSPISANRLNSPVQATTSPIQIRHEAQEHLVDNP